jgi:hypothetical protein
MTGLLKMDPAERLNGEQALAHPYFDDIREPSDRTPATADNDIDLSALIAPAQRPIYSSQSRITSYGAKVNVAPGSNPSALQT